MTERPRRRRAGMAPTLALLVGVAAAATVTPILVDDGGGAETPPPATSVEASATTEATVPPEASTTTSTTEVPPSSDPATEPVAPVLRVRVVPAVRDVGVMIDGTRYDSDADGLIEAPVADAEAEVTVVGYTVTPALQQITFTGWDDGSDEASRTLPPTGVDDEVALGVEVSYRITAAASGASAIVLRGDDGAPEALAPDTPTWVPARRAVPGPDGGLTTEELSYEVEVAGQAQPDRFTPTPEALLDVG